MDFRKYHNQKDCNIQNDCQVVPQSKEMSGGTKLKLLRGFITIKRNTREYYNQMTAREYNKIVLKGLKIDCKGAFQLTKLPGNTKIKMTVERNTTREYHNQQDCSGVLQTKVLPGSVKTKRLPESITDISKVLSESTTIKVLQGSIIIQSTARKFHKKELPVNVKIKGIPRSIIVKTTARECQIQNDDRECINQKNCH